MLKPHIRIRQTAEGGQPGTIWGTIWVEIHLPFDRKAFVPVYIGTSVGSFLAEIHLPTTGQLDVFSIGDTLSRPWLGRLV